MANAKKESIDSNILISIKLQSEKNKMTAL